MSYTPHPSGMLFGPHELLQILCLELDSENVTRRKPGFREGNLVNRASTLLSAPSPSHAGQALAWNIIETFGLPATRGAAPHDRRGLLEGADPAVYRENAGI